MPLYHLHKPHYKDKLANTIKEGVGAIVMFMFGGQSTDNILDSLPVCLYFAISHFLDMINR